MTWARKQRQLERRTPPFPRDIHIVSDGTAAGTFVENEKGERIRRVRAVEWRIDVETGLATVRLELTGVPIDARADRITIDRKRTDQGVPMDLHPRTHFGPGAIPEAGIVVADGRLIKRDGALRRIDE